ncbi:Deuterolysin metalloprotease (M35) family protein [Vibrio aerogenes CECT 7868]|uniref:Deuterolysin metalloprotease (M35) family protein n=1 Tax=Vibrio aerogenes CECT 7868 TaxID=1216006 RepID=A0A1M5ZEA3_9VIBR|nr:M35 family metallo-endopeptidase [Vibrio aerogenes]SHI22499.1 Deuterolysin metalloprotease (M35) family protein [Vibrio aerogenes CECT 7868]
MNNIKKLVLATALGSISSLAFAHSLEVTITPADQSFDKNSDVKVNLTITNTSQDDVKVLSWYLINDAKLQNNAFDVTVDGDAVAYTGPVVKRPAPQEDDYIQLAAGETITQSFDLSSFYDMTQTGTYSVQYDVDAFGLIKQTSGARSKAKEGLQKLESNNVSFWVDGPGPKTELLSKIQTAKAASAKFSLNFTGNCSNSKKSTLSNAVKAAQEISYDAALHLYDYWYKGDQSARYKTWFGAYTKARYTKVTDHFYKIHDAYTKSAVTMDCYCDPQLYDAYAYVYPNQPYHIHICNAFWGSPTKGTDSQSGTLVHEMSHFTVNGGTDDYVYGMSAVRSLAASSPDKAVMNADTHEYFAENPFNQ